jgi:hypothetical protein
LGEMYRSLSSSLGNFLHCAITSSLLGPNILLSILFSNNLSLRSSLNVSDQVSHPYKTTGKYQYLSFTLIPLGKRLAVHFQHMKTSGSTLSTDKNNDFVKLGNFRKEQKQQRKNSLFTSA